MTELIFAMVVALIWQAIRAGIPVCIRKMRAPKPQPLCADCFHAHVQYAANARQAISCTYGGAVRPMKLDVLYCTDYRARDLPLRAGVIGFVREIAPAE
jgi:hypothetical protein